MQGVLSQRLLLFDGLESTFRNIRLRPKNNNCHVCGLDPTITMLQDYEVFCGSKANDKDPMLNLMMDDDRITVEEYHKIINLSEPHVLIDVRSSEEFEICHLEGAINVPYADMKHRQTEKSSQDLIAKALDENKELNGEKISTIYLENN